MATVKGVLEWFHSDKTQKKIADSIEPYLTPSEMVQKIAKVQSEMIRRKVEGYFAEEKERIEIGEETIAIMADHELTDEEKLGAIKRTIKRAKWLKL